MRKGPGSSRPLSMCIRSASEIQLEAERDEAHEVLRHRRRLAEVGAGRDQPSLICVCARILPVLPVEHVLDIDPQLNGPAVAGLNAARDAHVEEAQSLAPDAINA